MGIRAASLVASDFGQNSTAKKKREAANRPAPRS
jgi:hypothetical protein